MDGVGTAEGERGRSSARIRGTPFPSSRGIRQIQPSQPVWMARYPRTELRIEAPHPSLATSNFSPCSSPQPASRSVRWLFLTADACISRPSCNVMTVYRPNSLEGSAAAGIWWSSLCMLVVGRPANGPEAA
jgi:hypothetical protein